MQRALLIALSTILIAGCDAAGSAPAPSALNGTQPQTGDGPTEADVRRLITGSFMAIYKESYMAENEMAIDFANLAFAPRTKKNLSGGYYDQPIDVWPVRAEVTITWRRGDEERTWKRGTSNNESFSFFKDDFGGWSFRTSGL